MTSYSISGFSFNIGSTTISQEYVPLVKEDVPWGINSTYIYKASTLRNQFNVNNKHLVIENQCLSGNIVFKTQDTGRIIINDLSVGTINGLPYSGSGSGVGLTANLIIYNLVNSTASIPYSIYLYDGTNSSLYFTPFQEIGIGLSHSVLLNLPNSSTIITIDTTNITINDYNIYSGATLDNFSTDFLSFTQNSGSSNIQVSFEVIPNPSTP